MVWFWKRDAVEMRLEIRYDRNTDEFMVVLSTGSGGVTERYKDIAAFKARLMALERHLEMDGWKNSGAPVLVPVGFATGPLRD